MVDGGGGKEGKEPKKGGGLGLDFDPRFGENRSQRI